MSHRCVGREAAVVEGASVSPALELGRLGARLGGVEAWRSKVANTSYPAVR
jgi:hypothetical protein